MMQLFAWISVAFGTVGIISTVVHAKNWERALLNELTTIGWFILAALCFRWG